MQSDASASQVADTSACAIRIISVLSHYRDLNNYQEHWYMHRSCSCDASSDETAHKLKFTAYLLGEQGVHQNQDVW